ncbi:hypothetical protein [Kitasatospora sp. NPDC101183]|uniref:hypothetical protein n=1 Tax=Kitasatospora sp. NPDC101183 TaxID=3364100 RepID=UPI0037FB9945
MGRGFRPIGASLPWLPRLLLLAALVLGVVTMHTLGHPWEAHGTHGMHDRPTALAAHAAQPAEVEPLAVPDRPTAHAAPPADGMDPMTVCLAVLAGWTLVLLAAAPLLHRSGDPAAALRARLLRAVRALPPPVGGRTLLNRLSVLRQ